MIVLAIVAHGDDIEVQFYRAFVPIAFMDGVNGLSFILKERGNITDSDHRN